MFFGIAGPAGGNDIHQSMRSSARERRNMILLQLFSLLAAIGATVFEMCLQYLPLVSGKIRSGRLLFTRLVSTLYSVGFFWMSFSPQYVSLVNLVSVFNIILLSFRFNFIGVRPCPFSIICIHTLRMSPFISPGFGAQFFTMSRAILTKIFLELFVMGFAISRLVGAILLRVFVTRANLRLSVRRGKNAATCAEQVFRLQTLAAERV